MTVPVPVAFLAAFGIFVVVAPVTMLAATWHAQASIETGEGFGFVALGLLVGCCVAVATLVA